MTYIIFFYGNRRQLARAFKTVTLSVHMTGFRKIGFVGEVCSNVSYLFVSITVVGEERPNFSAIVYLFIIWFLIGFLFPLVLGKGWQSYFIVALSMPSM